MSFTKETLSREFEQLEKCVTQHDNIMISLMQEIRNLIDSPESKMKSKLDSEFLRKRKNKWRTIESS